MNGLDLKRKLHAGETCLGVWLTLGDPAVSALLSHVGYDWMLVDTEHAPIPLDTLQTLVLMAQRGGTPAIVRPAWNDPVRIKQVLDLGAEGILVPMVNSGPEAERAVRAAKYPPAGQRGWGPNAAAEFGLRTEAYAAEANERIVVLVQIEHIDAVRNLDDILAVPGLDGVYIGPGDLSYSMGIPREWQNPKLVAAIHEVVEKAQAAGVPVGGDASGPLENIQRWLGYGAKFITVGADTSFIYEGASNLLNNLRAGSA